MCFCFFFSSRSLSYKMVVKSESWLCKVFVKYDFFLFSAKKAGAVS